MESGQTQTIRKDGPTLGLKPEGPTGQSGARVFAQPLDSRWPAAGQQMVLCAIGWSSESQPLPSVPSLSALENKMQLKLRYFVSMQIAKQSTYVNITSSTANK